MTDKPIPERVAETVAPWARNLSRKLAANIGSPWAANPTQQQAGDYYRSVFGGDGPETVDQLRRRIGDARVAEIEQQLTRDAGRMARNQV